MVILNEVGEFLLLQSFQLQKQGTALTKCWFSFYTTKFKIVACQIVFNLLTTEYDKS